jgi:hypothetical protein
MFLFTSVSDILLNFHIFSVGGTFSLADSFGSVALAPLPVPAAVLPTVRLNSPGGGSAEEDSFLGEFFFFFLYPWHLSAAVMSNGHCPMSMRLSEIAFLKSVLSHHFAFCHTGTSLE